MCNDENKIISSDTFWGEIDMHIEKSADSLVSELNDRKLKGKINIIEKELCID